MTMLDTLVNFLKRAIFYPIVTPRNLHIYKSNNTKQSMTPGARQLQKLTMFLLTGC